MASFKLLRASLEAKRRNKVRSDLAPIILLPGIIGSDADCAKLKLAFLELGHDVIVWKHPHHPENLISVDSAKPKFEQDMGAFLSSILTDYFNILQKEYPTLYAKLNGSISPTEVKHSSPSFFPSSTSDDLQLNIVGWSMGAIIAEQLGCAARAFITERFNRTIKTKINVVALDSPSTSMAAEELNANTNKLIQRAYAILQRAASEAGLTTTAPRELNIEAIEAIKKGSKFVKMPGTGTDCFKPTIFHSLVEAILSTASAGKVEAIGKFVKMTHVIQHLWALTAHRKFKPTTDEQVDDLLSISTDQTRKDYISEKTELDKYREQYAKNFRSVKLPPVILDTKLDHTSIVTTDFADRIAQASVYLFNQESSSIHRTLNPHTDEDLVSKVHPISKPVTITPMKHKRSGRSRFDRRVPSILPGCCVAGSPPSTGSDSDTPESDDSTHNRRLSTPTTFTPSVSTSTSTSASSISSKSSIASSRAKISPVEPTLPVKTTTLSDQFAALFTRRSTTHVSRLPGNSQSSASSRNLNTSKKNSKQQSQSAPPDRIRQKFGFPI